MRRAEGCLTVEMEAAAFFAVAQFRGVTFAQLLYGGDDVAARCGITATGALDRTREALLARRRGVLPIVDGHATLFRVSRSF